MSAAIPSRGSFPVIEASLQKGPIPCPGDYRGGEFLYFFVHRLATGGAVAVVDGRRAPLEGIRASSMTRLSSEAVTSDGNPAT
ncbi:hypothetical protein [Streptosporangium sp. NPDC002721]|uniref:hypothetical protein n=1 Tax=Streptosporangium sp. NPDC002721 TaxID=3366188 RepID=UPI0036AC75A1